MTLEGDRRYSTSTAVVSSEAIKFRAQMGFSHVETDIETRARLKKEITEEYGVIERDPNPLLSAVTDLIAKKDRLLGIDRRKMSDPSNLSGRVTVHPFIHQI